MKSMMFILACLVVSPVFACDEPATDRFIYNMLHFKRGTSDWRAVKGKTYEESRSFRVFAHAGRGIEDSYAIYKGEKHTIADADFCKVASNKLRVTTKEYGSVTITRRGSGDESTLVGRRGIFSLRFRPDHVVKRK